MNGLAIVLRKKYHFINCGKRGQVKTEYDYGGKKTLSEY
jgi:hypothetical protein